jgi:hypothetical protein
MNSQITQICIISAASCGVALEVDCAPDGPTIARDHLQRIRNLVASVEHTARGGNVTVILTDTD